MNKFGVLELNGYYFFYVPYCCTSFRFTGSRESFKVAKIGEPLSQ